MREFSKQYKKVACIYKITSPSGKVYIGQTWDLGHRYRAGISKNQLLLFRSYEKHGEAAHQCEIIMQFDATATQQDLDEWEIYYMKKHQLEGVELLNIRDGGSRGKAGESTKIKISENKRQWHLDNPERSKKVVTAASLANTGSKRSGETKNKISSALTKHVRTHEHNKSISEVKKGIPSGRKGIKFSEQAIENIRAGVKNRVMTTLRSVSQYTKDGEFVKLWPSIVSAATELKISKGNINACASCRKHALTAGGFIWQYGENTNSINPAGYKQEFNPKRTKVAQMMGGVIIKIFDSVKEAVAATGTDRAGIFGCLAGKRNKAGGFNWQKVN